MMKPTPSTTPQLRVAAYCRFDASGEDQNATLEAQRACYTEKINANPDWTMAGVFADTGNSRSERPEFQKMLRKCRQKKIDLILVKSVSRFARNYLDCLATVRELRELGIAVIFERENINTLDSNCDQYISIIGAIAKVESECISHGICTGCFRCMVESKRVKGTWEKTSQLPGFPQKTIIFRTE